MIKNKTYITINTDASFHPIHKSSGWAFCIVHDNFRIKSSGQFLNVKPQNSLEAEMYCIGNALFVCKNLIQKYNVDVIIINTDCKYAINKIKSNKCNASKIINSFLIEIQKNKDILIKFKYVPAHTGGIDARTHVNEWCDSEAKKWMKKGIKK